MMLVIHTDGFHCSGINGGTSAQRLAPVKVNLWPQGTTAQSSPAVIISKQVIMGESKPHSGCPFW